MRKQFSMFLYVIITILSLAGCTLNNTVSFTYAVDTGDRVKVTLNTEDGYTIGTGNPFIISKDGEDILTCQFLSKVGYDYFTENLTDEFVKLQNGHIIENGNKDNFDYTFYTVESKFIENNFFVKLNDQTSLIIGSLADETEAKNCFDLLSFEIIK